MTLLGCAIFGLSFGGLGISVNVLVAEGAPSRILRQAFAGLHCMYGGASLVAPLLVTLLYHLGANWRSALAWLALAPLVVVAVTLVFAEPMETREMRRRLHAGPTGAESVPKASRNWRAAAYFSALMTLYVISEISVSTRLALLTRREWGYSIEQANQILAGFFLGMFSGRLLFALIPLGMKSRYVLAWSAALSFLSYALALQVHPAWILLTGLAMSVFYPCAISMVNEGRAPREAHFITTWAITAQSLGVMFLHPMLGILADHYGLGRALWMGPISVMGALALLWWAVRFQPQSNCAIT